MRSRWPGGDWAGPHARRGSPLRNVRHLRGTESDAVPGVPLATPRARGAHRHRHRPARRRPGDGHRLRRRPGGPVAGPGRALPEPAVRDACALGARRQRLDRSRPARRGAGGGSVLGSTRPSGCRPGVSSRRVPFYARALRRNVVRGVALENVMQPGAAARGVLVPGRGSAPYDVGRGSGRPCCAHRLDRVRGPAYLESSKRENNPTLRATRLRAARLAAAARRSRSSGRCGAPAEPRPGCRGRSGGTPRGRRRRGCAGGSGAKAEVPIPERSATSSTPRSVRLEQVLGVPHALLDQPRAGDCPVSSRNRRAKVRRLIPARLARVGHVGLEVPCAQARVGRRRPGGPGGHVALDVL
jgi:hypothetical protein